MWNQDRLSSSTKWNHKGDDLDLFFTADNAYAYGTCWVWNPHYSYTLYLELWNDKTFFFFLQGVGSDLALYIKLKSAYTAY